MNLVDSHMDCLRGCLATLSVLLVRIAPLEYRARASSHMDCLRECLATFNVLLVRIAPLEYRARASL